MVNSKDMPPNLYKNNAPNHSSKKHDVGFNLIAITFIIAAIGLAIAYFIDNYTKKTPNLPSLYETSPKLNKIIAGQKLAIPSSWFRFSDQRHEEFSKQIDLHFTLNLGKNNAPMEVYLTISPIREALPSSVLLDSVYIRQFKSEQLKGINGLIGKPLKPSKGYGLETIWYDPININPFVAKCLKPIAGQSEQKCIRTISISNKISATFMFNFELLDNWKNFDSEAYKWFEKIDIQ